MRLLRQSNVVDFGLKLIKIMIKPMKLNVDMIAEIKRDERA